MKRYLPIKSAASAQLTKVAIIALILLGGAGMVGAGFVFKQAFSNSKETQIVNDPSRYTEIRHKLWLNQNQLKHFPADISAHSPNVFLAYSPASSQGNSFFQVRLKLPNQQIKKLLSEYRTIAKYRYRGGNTNDHANLSNGVPTTFFYTSDSQEDSFPVSYEIFVLDARDRSNSDFKWNHGNSYGVAIDSSASEIVYWAEEW
ncbi:hypothetical protein ACF3DV_28200 [Chlorogloeopsis fritschii PCC 9212]|uniref:Uncharacterized protein n=1 Tax=Chlorogloeopsis fritschii PCC 6912 TaxID=211165 RepID=A0A3S0ZQX4_CHLFR|nr:hypothetical protein [Chlorogloeopsis fritschii]MBF2006544.1 hypothetical protein [Chlorogloeopsis fritschii C42_A2020_084]RUR77827.1 hypothetical protein PCC6912_37080 [Chlorogloeopsis fritschii PCC 6912]